MVEQVVGLPAELQFVAFLPPPEGFLHIGIEHEPGWPGHRVSPGVSELIDRLQSKCAGVEPPRRGRGIDADALSGGVGTIGVDVRVGAIDAGAGIDVKSGAPGSNAAHLPSARQTHRGSHSGVRISALCRTADRIGRRRPGGAGYRRPTGRGRTACNVRPGRTASRCPRFECRWWCRSTSTRCTTPARSPRWSSAWSVSFPARCSCRVRRSRPAPAVPNSDTGDRLAFDPGPGTAALTPRYDSR